MWYQYIVCKYCVSTVRCVSVGWVWGECMCVDGDGKLQHEHPDWTYTLSTNVFIIIITADLDKTFPTAAW